VPIVLKSGILNLLEPSGPVQACNGFALATYILFLEKASPLFFQVGIYIPGLGNEKSDDIS